MDKIDGGSWTWKRMTNHNKMMALQDGAAATASPTAAGPVEVAFFGSSAFRITSPLGLSLMIDPWRNFPTGKWDWYFQDFPEIAVDIGVSSHAHFDHDALHRLDAHVLLERLIGRYEFADLAITGIADKHATDSRDADYDFKKVIHSFDGIDIEPPDNPRSWDHCLLLVETGGLRICHWGDNRHDPPAGVWEHLGEVDILLLPVDASRHVLGYGMGEEIIERARPKVVIPDHYYIFDVTQRQSTLKSADEWVSGRKHVRLSSATQVYERAAIEDHHALVHYFGEHVAFDTARWRRG